MPAPLKMRWKFVAVDSAGQEIVTYETENANAAQGLFGALGTDILDSGVNYTNGELSAAEEALTVAINPPIGFTEGLVFLESIRNHMEEFEQDECFIVTL